MKQSINLKKYLLTLLLLVTVERFCHWQTQGFRLGKVAQAFISEAKVSSLCGEKAKRESAYTQSYHFLGSGAQFYAFSSQDGQYVLKFFKTHHGFICSSKKRQRRLQKLFASAELAQKTLLSETGILALHLQATHEHYRTVTIYDRLNIAHQIDLDQVAFLLQERAQPAAERLRNLIEASQYQEAKTAIRALLNLTEKTVQLGIKNKDIKLIRNCGFVGEKPLILDIGSLSQRKEIEQTAISKVHNKALNQLSRWLRAHYPEQKGLIDEL